MLPLNLLRVRTRKGQIKPVYADINEENLELANTLTGLFQRHVGKLKGDLLNEVSKHEMGQFDYRLVRGLSQILQRHCSFEVKTTVDPGLARRMIFEEASRRGFVSTRERRKEILETVAKELQVAPKQLEDSFYADLDEQLFLKEFHPVAEVELLQQYNLSLTQTLLFRSTFVEILVSDYWKEVLRDVKHRGLIYSAESRNGVFRIVVDGPLSLFKLTQRYGTSLAKIIPTVVRSHRWEIKGSIVRTGQLGKRLYNLRLTSAEVADKIRPGTSDREEDKVAFDSSVEKKFFMDFQSLGTGWKIVREPTPLIVGKHVLVADFCFEKGSIKVFMEVVGFWTREYLKRKIKKLNQLTGVDMIVAADEKLVCDRLRKAGEKVIFYKRYVPVKPILEILKAREYTILEREIQDLDLAKLELQGDVVSLRQLAKQHNVSVDALKQKLEGHEFSGYRLIGNNLISDRKMGEIESKIESLGSSSLLQVVGVIESEGVDRPYAALEALNYGVRWEGLDLKKGSIFKKQDVHPP